MALMVDEEKLRRLLHKVFELYERGYWPISRAHEIDNVISECKKD